MRVRQAAAAGACPVQVLVTYTPLYRKEVAVFFRVLHCQAQRWDGPGRAQPLQRRSEGAVVLHLALEAGAWSERLRGA